VYRFCKYKPYTLFACTLVHLQLAVNITASSLFKFHDFDEKYGWLTATGACAAAAANIGNTSVLCYSLSLAKTEIDIKRQALEK